MSEDAQPSPGPGVRLFMPGELRRVVLGFSTFFLILCSYYILRPVRDAMAVQYGADRLQWLFTATFAFTLLIVPLFGWLVRSLRRDRVLPVVYGFLMLNLAAFSLAFSAGIQLAAAMFFVWLSVFNLFVVSLFWSNMGDCFTTAQSHRFYGYIAAGGTCGALAGPALTAVLARQVDTQWLLLLSAILLGGAALCVVSLRRIHASGSTASDSPIGGDSLAAIRLTWAKGPLRGIALLVICYTTVSTFIYIELVRHVGEQYQSAGERTSFFATIDFAVNVATLLLQLLGTRAVVHHLGLKTALPLAPALVLVILSCLSLFATWRSALGLAMVQGIHRAGEYALGKPAREMIYTTVDVESRYKAKNFIDTAIYRAGDASSGWLLATARAAGLDTLLVVALPAALIWIATAFGLGARHDRYDPA